MSRSRVCRCPRGPVLDRHGDNQSVSGAQIAEALPDEALQKAAAQAGVSPQEAADQIAQALPAAVDKLSPEGQLPDGSLEDIIRAQKF
ncbi:YidB family protein [Streptomyces kutzneri]|uniref:YidB family protein n=1 Tax=Streptomyces kutzneri TaxID=3051179 RepID=UPI0028D8EA51|nr:YidB family protein [Streptomyces sp. DSM 40907]